MRDVEVPRATLRALLGARVLAGGHLSAANSTHFQQRLYPAVDAADQESCRPDFAVAVYPGHLWLDYEEFQLNPDVPVTRETPPTFLLQAEDDSEHAVEQGDAACPRCSADRHSGVGDRREHVAESVEATVRGARVVVGGMLTGLAMCSVVALALGAVREPPETQLGRLMLIALALVAVACAAAYFILRQALIRDLVARAPELRQNADPSTLILPRYRGFVVVGAGLIEGPGFFANIAYVLTGNPVAMGAVACAALLLLAHLPSVDSLRRLAQTAARPEG